MTDEIEVQLGDERVREFGRAFQVAYNATDAKDDEDFRHGVAVMVVTNILLELLEESEEETDDQPS